MTAVILSDNQKVRRKSQRIFLLIVLVSVLPIAAAYIAFFTGIGIPSQTVNTGVFIKPAISLEPLVSSEKWQDWQIDKKWRLLIPLSEGCFNECEINLYTTRQVHIRLDQRSNRLQRIAVILDDSFSSSRLDEIKKQHPGLQIMTANPDTVAAWFKTLDKLPYKNNYFLIDQEGRAMMAYDQQHHGNDVLRDIKRALKYSIDYQ